MRLRLSNEVSAFCPISGSDPVLVQQHSKKEAQIACSSRRTLPLFFTENASHTATVLQVSCSSISSFPSCHYYFRGQLSRADMLGMSSGRRLCRSQQPTDPAPLPRASRSANRPGPDFLFIKPHGASPDLELVCRTWCGACQYHHAVPQFLRKRPLQVASMQYSVCIPMRIGR